MFLYKVLGIVLTLLASCNCELGTMRKMYTSRKLISGARRFLEKGPLPPQTTLFDLIECSPRTCALCNKKVGNLLSVIKLKKLKPADIRKVMYNECNSFEISKAACESYIDLNFDIFKYILTKKPDITSEHFCGVVYESCGCKRSNTTSALHVSLKFGPKPTRKHIKKVKPARKPMTILHISDIHYDPLYTAFSNTACLEPMCCRGDQGKPSRSQEAGYWGDYRRCDLPWHTFTNALQHIKNKHKKIDFIYMTGDIVSHAIWETTIQKNAHAIVPVLRKLKEMFPNVPVYPILGNHDPSPLNIFTPPDIKESSTGLLYQLVADEWSAWLPKETKETILTGGYYSVLVKPGFRVVGINSNMCYTLNWFLAIEADTQFLLDHLNWLARTLYAAEQAGEKVHILSHIPLSDMCLHDWCTEYKRIIDRFESTVLAQFVGHTHWDEFEIYYSLDNSSRAINVAFNGGSLTHYDNLNSNYKIYSMDPHTYEILDGETWIFNLTEANTNHNSKTTPKWFKLYSYKEAFGMKSLDPEEFDKLAYRMASDKALLKKYAWYFVKAADTALPCDDKCLEDKLCRMTTVHVKGNSYCYRLKEKKRQKRAQYEYPAMPGVKYNNLSFPVYSNTSRCDCP